MKNKPTILILGYKRSGKDTAAEFWKKNFGLTFQSSSRAAAEIFIFDRLRHIYNYDNVDQCFEDRVNHRAEWFDLICEYNKNDKTRLAKEIVQKTGCYVGMRNFDEVEACISEEIFDLIIWIDGEQRVGIEDKDSCTITPDQADIIITNNTSEQSFITKLNSLGKILFKN